MCYLSATPHRVDTENAASQFPPLLAHTSKTLRTLRFLRALTVPCGASSRGIEARPLAMRVFIAAALLTLAAAQSFFPCHPTKPDVNNEVTCSRVVLPPGLCKRCPLRPTRKDGRFVQCTRIYDTEGDDCHEALQEYVDENGKCDPVRKDALAKMLDGDEDARMVIDYFLYSLCEQCCDCIPMGTEKSDYMKFARGHSTSNPTLWKEDRGNCPAHAHFDVCKVVPNVRYFAQPGDPEKRAPEACPLLKKWQRSDEFAEWQFNPQTNIVPDLQEFLSGMLAAIDCHDFDVWGKCYDMENKQNHLELPDDYVEPEVDSPTTEAPTTTEAENTTDAATTTSTTTHETSTSSTTSDATKPTTTMTTTTTSTDGSTTTLADDTTTTEAEATDTTTTTTTTTTTDADPNITTGTTAPTSATDTTGTTSTSPDSTEPAPESETSDPSTDNVPPIDTESNAVGDTGDETSTSSSEDGNTSADESTPSSDGDSSGSCFPAAATVELESGEFISMAEVRIGDSVRVSKDTFSEVFLFSHRTASNSAPYYIELSTYATNKTLTVTSGHYLRVNDGLVSAELVKSGDHILTASNGWASVSAVRVVRSSGLYNPHTVHGDIVVNGFVASTYTTAVPTRVAYGLLAPLRTLYSHGFVSEKLFGSFLSEGYRSLLPRSVEL